MSNVVNYFLNGFCRIWRHPDRHQRPNFDQIVTEFDVDDDELLLNGPHVEPIRGSLGVDVDTNTGLYEDLQYAYKGMGTLKWLGEESRGMNYFLIMVLQIRGTIAVVSLSFEIWCVNIN